MFLGRGTGTARPPRSRLAPNALLRQPGRARRSVPTAAAERSPVHQRLPVPPLPNPSPALGAPVPLAVPLILPDTPCGSGTREREVAELLFKGGDALRCHGHGQLGRNPCKREKLLQRYRQGGEELGEFAAGGVHGLLL